MSNSIHLAIFASNIQISHVEYEEERIININIKSMKKLFLAAVLAAQVFSATAQTAEQKPYAEKMDKIEAEYKTLETSYGAIAKKDPATMTDADKKQVQDIIARANELDSALLATALEIAEKFKATTFPAKYVSMIANSLEYDQLKALLDPSTGYYNEADLKAAKELLKALELRVPGKMFTDLSMPNLEGKTVKLSDWCGKGNYVLVDFWASWCGPCRAEMPNVVEAYKKYHAKGFEVIGVSFDQKKEAWAAAVKKLGMEWPQMSDLKGWQSAGASAYGIRAIPANVLLDPQGKIVAVDLREQALQDKLAEIYK